MKEAERAREADPKRSSEEGGQWVLEGPQRGDGGYWRDCGGCGGRSALVLSVCTVMLVDTCTTRLGSVRPRPASVRSYHTVTVLKRLSVSV